MRRKVYEYDYPMPSVTTDVVVVKVIPGQTREVLLIKRKNEPFKDCWAFPGGFLDMNETLSECASRELKEETGLTVPSKELSFVTMLDDVERDPRGRVLSAVFACLLREDVTVQASDDAKEVAWFPVDDLPRLAFDHGKVIEQTLLPR
jgi:8-oxo-dGTP diphosphatase